jgi:hypothetical protein
MVSRRSASGWRVRAVGARAAAAAVAAMLLSACAGLDEADEGVLAAAATWPQPPPPLQWGSERIDGHDTIGCDATFTGDGGLVAAVTFSAYPTGDYGHIYRRGPGGAWATASEYSFAAAKVRPGKMAFVPDGSGCAVLQRYPGETLSVACPGQREIALPGTTDQFRVHAASVAGTAHVVYHSRDGIVDLSPDAGATLIAGPEASTLFDVAVGPDQRLHVIYVDSTGGQRTRRLYYGTRSAQGWSFEAVPVGFIGNFSGKGAYDHAVALAIDGQGNPWIAAAPTSSDRLRVASRIAGRWTVETVDANRDVSYGGPVVLRFAKSGELRVAFGSETGAWYGVRTGTGWSMSRVVDADSVPMYGLHAFILDDQDRPLLLGDRVANPDDGAQAVLYRLR